MQFQPLNLSALVQFYDYQRLGPYERYRRLIVLSGNKATLKFHGFNFANGGTRRLLSGKRYTLLVDGVEAGATNVPSGTYEANFDVDLTKLQPGWRRVDIGGLADGESSPAYWVFVKRGTVAAQPYMPVVRSTHEAAWANDNGLMWMLAPYKYSPTPRPLTVQRAYASIPGTLSRQELHCEALVPVRYNDIHRPNVNVDGLMSAFDLQTYFWDQLIAPKPIVACLDGPRGVGTTCMLTHVEVGNAAPNGALRNNTYFSDAWRIGKISEDGTITTLVGYRHRNSMLSHYEDSTADVELVGDWSQIPASRRGFHELWGFAWDNRTLTINEAAPPIPTEGNEKPHITGPVLFAADSQNNRICRIEFSATAHGVPPKVTEFITTLGDPWDVVYDDGKIYVSERKSHRICEYDATTGRLLRVVVQGLPLAVIVDQGRRVSLTATREIARGAPCVAPEGLFYQDGWLYFASFAQAEVRRVNLATGKLEVVRPIYVDGNSRFAKLAVSDGTFGPRGSTLTWTWSNAYGGLPQIVRPDGVDISISRKPGGTGTWGDDDGWYATAGAAAHGRLISGGVVEGLLRITKSQPGDLAKSEATERGRTEYHRRGFHLLHGASGHGFYGLPLPWGESSDIDAFLTLYGHRR